MASLSAYFSYDANTMDRGIPYAQFTAFQYNTGGNAWYNPALGQDNKLFGTGYNADGGLGLGTSVDCNTFTALTGNWSQVECGAYHTMALSAGTNALFGTGMNGFSQLGLGNTTNRSTFTPLTGNWSQIACGYYHTMALSAGTNTRWFGTGFNGDGELGLGTNGICNTFTALTGNWSQVTCGTYHTMALSAGTTQLFGTGWNYFGQLGLGTNLNCNTFTALTGNWSQVTCGYSHTLALSAGTTQWFATGYNNYGQCGLAATLSANTFTALTGNWSQMKSNPSCDFTMALSAGTNAWFGTGRNDSGQLGLGDTVQRTTFTQLPGNWSQVTCGGKHTMALSAGTNTKWFTTGSNSNGQLGVGGGGNINTFTALTGNWSKLACGQYYTMALAARSPLASPLVVDNFENQPITFKMRPITNSGVTGSETSFTYVPLPALFGTGDNTSGQLGLGNSGAGTNRNTLTQLIGNWSQVTCGVNYIMAISAGTTRLYGAGYNFGALGLGSNSPLATLTPLTGSWSQVACGKVQEGNAGHTMVLSAGTTKLFGTGGNGSGQLGLGNTINCNTLTQLTGNWSQVACGTNHTMALSAGTTALFSTGSNSVGQLGLGNTGVNKNTFTQVLGTGVNPSAVGNWSQVTCGYNYTMAQSAGTTLWFGTGDCAYGQLGVGMYGAGYALASFYQAQGNWSQMVCGESHTMAQSAGTNTWFGVGRNSEGQLGLGRFDTGGNIYYNNTFTQLTGDWSQMVCGQYHTMALSAGTNNKWFGTGYNTSGQLGLGNTTNRNTFTALTGSWLQMSCGGIFTMATWY